VPSLGSSAMIQYVGCMGMALIPYQEVKFKPNSTLQNWPVK